MPQLKRWLTWLSALVGAWVFLSLSFFDLSTGPFWNNIATGGAIIVLAGYAGTRAASDLTKIWMSGLVVILGLWLMATPIVFPATGMLGWSNVASGVGAAVLSSGTAYFASKSHRARRARIAGA